MLDHRKTPAPTLTAAAALFAALTLLALAVAATACSSAGRHNPTRRHAGGVLRLDWRSGTNSAFSNLECPHPETQFKIVTSPTRNGGRAARFTIHADDKWADGTVRCLDANYNTSETVGDRFYFGFSVYVPDPGLSNNLIWELHQPASLYKVAGCGLAPFALFVHGGTMQFRISTGDCTVGEGNAHHELNIPIKGLAPYPRKRWIDFVVAISFSEHAGSVDVWTHLAGERWPTAPVIHRRGIPTLPFCSSCGVHDVKLYTELGLYPGSTNYSGTDTVYLDAYKRGPTFASVQP